MCTKYPGLGAECTFVRCDAGLVCNLGKCIEQYSVPQDGECGDFEGDGSSVCAPGFYCYDTGHRSGVCAKGFASSKKACSFTDPCTNPNETCACQPPSTAFVCTAPLTFTSSQTSSMIAVEKCSFASNCDPDDINCCHNDQCSLYNSVKNDFYLPNYCGTNPAPSCSSGLSSGEIAGIVIGVILVVAVISILTVVLVRRKRSQYAKF